MTGLSIFHRRGLALLCAAALGVFSWLQAGETGRTATADTPAVTPIGIIIQNARNNVPGSLSQYRQWRLAHPDAPREDDRSASDSECLALLDSLASCVDRAEELGRTALGNPDFGPLPFVPLAREALAVSSVDTAPAFDAVHDIAAAWRYGDGLIRGREQLFGRFQREAARGTVAPGTRLAWSLVRVGAAGPDIAVLPGSFRYDDDSAEITLRYLGEPVHVSTTAADFGKTVRATVDGYRFSTGWAVLFQKPLGWMVETARVMRQAGVDPELQPDWFLLEAPDGLIALAGLDSAAAGVPTQAFFAGGLHDVVSLPDPADAGQLEAEFAAAAKALHDGIMGDDSIPGDVRQALAPVLKGTYGPVDPRDYFDSNFCRRLIEADYLASHVELTTERQAELAAYRTALAKLEAGIDRFAVLLADGERLVAVDKPDSESAQQGDYSDAETGESVFRHQWRWERADSTVFHSPLPSRYLYAMSVQETYPGRHSARPAGVAASTEVRHAVLGRLASYRDGDAYAEGDAGKWLEAVILDARGRRESNTGPLGWNFPLFVPVRDDQGDPVLLATLNGVVPSPDFSKYTEETERRRAQDAWLDRAASVLSTPGELALIFQQFFRYCSDSPLPEMPNLIGSHLGLSDTHQTVYQSLERRWVGRLIGDCDDLAEFFQELTERQGKLCHVMQLPAHAAAGYLEELPDGGYEFIVLQTGPVMRFLDSTREGAVEKAYRYFDEEEGSSQFTLAAVPLLLRFADDDTRTPFVLSARIYWDREYAEAMIQVQEYWHLNTFAAGVTAMEKMVATDREIGNLKELASLYERVGRFDRSLAMRQEELEAVRGDILPELAAHLEIAQLHVNGKNKPAAMASLREAGDILRRISREDPRLYARTLWIRTYWAALLARLGEPYLAWEIIGPDVDGAVNASGGLSDSMLRTVVTLYDRMAADRGTGTDSEASAASRRQAGRILERAFGRGYFKEDDSYNKIHSRYYLLGRYAVAATGRQHGLGLLWQDGPYPDGSRSHHGREVDCNDADWEWLRIMPRLYLALGLEMLDWDDYPELYDPVAARRTLEGVSRAVEKGKLIGSNVVGDDALVRSELALAFLNRDLDAFRRVMTLVRGKDYSSLYDDAALSFGQYCGLVPADRFGEWIQAFHEFFPGRQQYFKAAYRAMDKEHYDHALMLARASAGFFPGDSLFATEAVALEEAVARLRAKRPAQDWDRIDWTWLEDGDGDMGADHSGTTSEREVVTIG